MAWNLSWVSSWFLVSSFLEWRFPSESLLVPTLPRTVQCLRSFPTLLTMSFEYFISLPHFFVSVFWYLASLSYMVSIVNPVWYFSIETVCFISLFFSYDRCEILSAPPHCQFSVKYILRLFWGYSIQTSSHLFLCFCGLSHHHNQA